MTLFNFDSFGGHRDLHPLVFSNCVYAVRFFGNEWVELVSTLSRLMGGRPRSQICGGSGVDPLAFL